MKNGFIDLHHIPGLLTGLTIFCIEEEFLDRETFFLKQNPSEANLTINDLKGMLHSQSYDSLMSKLMHCAKNVSGTNAYWNRAKNDLKSIITQVGVPTIFWTWDKDYEDLLNSVQRHMQCFTAYCLHKKQQDELSCRFNFPKECCEVTHLQYEKLKSKDGIEHYKVKVVTKRNDSRLNNHQRTQLQGWRANCDIQVIIDYHSCLEYIAKYASKAEKYHLLQGKLLHQWFANLLTKMILREL